MDTFTLTGAFETKPTSGSLSGVPSLVASLDERVQLENKSIQYFDLTGDAPVSVLFPTSFDCNVLVVKVDGGKARVRLTSSDGSTQSVPVDGFLVLMTYSVPITAIDLTRAPGVQVQVQVFMGDQA